MEPLRSDPFQLEHQLAERCAPVFSQIRPYSVDVLLELNFEFHLQVEKQCAHFFGVTINEEQAESGIVVRVTSAAQSKFKV